MMIVFYRLITFITSSIDRVTSFKTSIGVITHQGHISQVSANAYGRTSLLERLVTLKNTYVPFYVQKTLFVGHFLTDFGFTN